MEEVDVVVETAEDTFVVAAAIAVDAAAEDTVVEEASVDTVVVVGHQA